jgi:DNA-binding NarL/FixJ family response regulator
MAWRASTEDPRPSAFQTLPSPGFVGRDREMALLADALSHLPAVVLVEGEPGIGKSRLLHEFLSSPAGRRCRPMLATCPPFREPYTLGPVVDAVRQATDSVVDLPLSGLAGALRPMFPEWADDLPPAPEPLADPSASRYRVFRALAELLGHLNVAVLVVEDVHWADDATLEFLLFLVSRQPPPVSLVVTYRPQDIPADSLLLRLSSRVLAGGAPVRLALEPLDVDGTRDLVSSMLDGGPVSTDFAAFVHRHTDGVPLAIEESVRLMHGRADLARRGGEWVRRRLEVIDVPPTVRDAVLERSQRLGADARAVLDAAAVLAEPASEATLVAVSGLSAEAAEAGLPEALGSGLLREDDRGLLAFRHALAARAVYRAIPAPRRRALHLRAGRALEGAAPLPLARLARHFREAGDTEAWCRYAEQAADLALASSDEAAAGSLLHDLLTNADLPPASVTRLIRKLPLLSSTGPSWFRALVTLLRTLLATTSFAPGEEAEVRLLLGRVLLTMEEYGQAYPELERAVAHLPVDSVDAVAAMTYLGHPRNHASASECRRWLRRAAALPTASVPSGVGMTLLVERVGALLALGEESGWAEAAGIRDDAVPRRDLWRVAVGHLNVGGSAVRWGRYGEAALRLGRALELAEHHEYPRIRNLATAARAHLRWFTGDWAGLLDQASALAGNESMQPVSRDEAVLVVGLMQAAAGESDRSAENLQHVLDRAGGHGALDSAMEPAAALAALRLADGDADAALRVTDGPVDTVTRWGTWVWAADLAPVRVEALLAAGRTDDAARLVTAFARGLRGRNAPAPRAGLALCRALVAEHLDGPVRAAALFARAADAWRALPRPYDALLARERQARCLLAAGRAEPGLTLLTDVHTGLSDLGARAAADRVHRVLREHGVATPHPRRGGRPSYGDRLSPRELDVVRLLVQGRTNRQIAEALVLSTQTVASHLRSAMRKLHVGSRTALAVSAVERGLVGDDHTADNRDE